MPHRWVAVSCCCVRFIAAILVVLLRSVLLYPVFLSVILIRRLGYHIGVLMNGYDSGLSAKILITGELEVLRSNLKTLLAENEIQPLLADDEKPQKIISDRPEEAYWDALTDVKHSGCLPYSIRENTANSLYLDAVEYEDMPDLHEGILNRYQTYQHTISLRRQSFTKVLISDYNRAT